MLSWIHSQKHTIADIVHTQFLSDDRPDPVLRQPLVYFRKTILNLFDILYPDAAMVIQQLRQGHRLSLLYSSRQNLGHNRSRILMYFLYSKVSFIFPGNRCHTIRIEKTDQFFLHLVHTGTIALLRQEFHALCVFLQKFPFLYFLKAILFLMLLRLLNYHILNFRIERHLILAGIL